MSCTLWSHAYRCLHVTAPAPWPGLRGGVCAGRRHGASSRQPCDHFTARFTARLSAQKQPPYLGRAAGGGPAHARLATGRGCSSGLLGCGQRACSAQGARAGGHRRRQRCVERPMRHQHRRAGAQRRRGSNTCRHARRARRAAACRSRALRCSHGRTARRAPRLRRGRRRGARPALAPARGLRQGLRQGLLQQRGGHGDAAAEAPCAAAREGLLSGVVVRPHVLLVQSALHV